MVGPDPLVPLLPELAARTRPRHGTMVRAMSVHRWRDPLAETKTSWPRNRFNKDDGAHMLYLGNDFLTCAHESLVTLVPTRIVAFAPVEYRLQAVLDLTSPTIQTVLQTDDVELSANFRCFVKSDPPTPTQALGEALAASGRFDGILYASAAHPGGHCLAVILDALEPLGGLLSVFDRKNGIDLHRP